MNYEPNTTHWPKDAPVIHDADAKRADMLMVVIGRTRDGLVRTQYRDRQRGRKVYTNELRFLLDPARFGIAVGSEGETKKAYPFAPDYRIPIGEFITEEMEARGWSKRELADRSGLGVVALDLLLAGEVRVSQPVAACLSKAFGTSAEFWISLDTIGRGGQ